MEDKRFIGRPTDYCDGHCQQLLEHMAAGLSFEAFAGALGVSKQTLYNWTEKFPEFMDAKKRGEAMSLLWWEKEGKDGMWSGKQFNPAVWYMNMKNRHGWRDKLEVSSDDSKPFQITMNYERKKKPKADE